MNLYAVLDSNNKCIYVTNYTTGEDNFIKIDVNKESTFFIGKYYDKDKCEFYSKQSITNADILAEVKKSQQDIIDEYTMELINQGVL